MVAERLSWAIVLKMTLCNICAYLLTDTWYEINLIKVVSKWWNNYTFRTKLQTLHRKKNKYKILLGITENRVFTQTWQTQKNIAQKHSSKQQKQHKANRIIQTWNSYIVPITKNIRVPEHKKYQTPVERQSLTRNPDKIIKYTSHCTNCALHLQIRYWSSLYSSANPLGVGPSSLASFFL